MPKVEINIKDLLNLIGKRISIEKLNELFSNLKGEIESVKDDWATISLEDTNRPELLSVEGMSFQIKGSLGIEKGFKVPKVRDSGITIKVEDVFYRPYISAVVVKGVKLNDVIIRELMNFEEKLDLSYGRKRKKSAIGIYDLDKINSKVIEYKLVSRDERFVPLGFKNEMRISEVLKKHPKGIEYSSLVKDKVPALVGKGIISIPPITNSEDTKIEEKTKNLLIEATGTNEETVDFVIRLISYLFWIRGGKILSVRIKGKKNKVTPNLKIKRFKLNYDLLRKKMGLEISNSEINKILKKMRFNVKKNYVEIPPIRNDIMDDVDVVEEILIGFGYNNIEPLDIKFFTRGKRIDDKIREIRKKLIGAGFQEVMTYTLIDKDSLDKIGVKGMRILNPCNSNYTHIRPTIIPSHLKFLARNKTVEYPQKIFEIGHTVENGKDKTKLCVTISDSKVSFTDIKRIYNLLSNDKIERCENKIFVPGRAAKSKRCVFGEVHPKILSDFDLEMPVVVLEMEI